MDSALRQQLLLDAAHRRGDAAWIARLTGRRRANPMVAMQMLRDWEPTLSVPLEPFCGDPVTHHDRDPTFASRRVLAKAIWGGCSCPRWWPTQRGPPRVPLVLGLLTLTFAYYGWWQRKKMNAD